MRLEARRFSDATTASASSLSELCPTFLVSLAGAFAFLGGMRFSAHGNALTSPPEVRLAAVALFAE
jgi:hypothetical protein